MEFSWTRIGLCTVRFLELVLLTTCINTHICCNLFSFTILLTCSSNLLTYPGLNVFVGTCGLLWGSNDQRWFLLMRTNDTRRTLCTPFLALSTRMAWRRHMSHLDLLLSLRKILEHSVQFCIDRNCGVSFWMNGSHPNLKSKLFRF